MAPTTVAPSMMTTRPAAASGVSPVRMRSSPGRIRPSPPRISATPMKCRNQPGMAICLVISSTVMMNFMLPANRKSAASSA